MPRAQNNPADPSVVAPEDVTPEWLTEILRADGALKSAEVVAVERERIGTGLVGLNFRFFLKYDGEGTGAPRSLVGKFPSAEEQSRRAAKLLRTYEREARFYLNLAKAVDIRTPHCYSAALEAEGERFHLILEDMAPDVQGDQIRGCDLREAAAALVELAGLHAPLWNDPALKLDEFAWLARSNEETDELMRTMYAQSWDGFVRTYGARLQPEAVALGETFGANLGTWQRGWEAPMCVTHGDFRLDNMMFGKAKGKIRVTTVDWQTVGVGAGVMDASYFLGNGLLRSDRREHERSLVERYHGALVERGVSDYSREDCLQDYRRATLCGIAMTVIASQVVAVDERGVEMFGAMAERHFAHAMDQHGEAFLS